MDSNTGFSNSIFTLVCIILCITYRIYIDDAAKKVFDVIVIFFAFGIAASPIVGLYAGLGIETMRASKWEKQFSREWLAMSEEILNTASGWMHDSRINCPVVIIGRKNELDPIQVVWSFVLDNLSMQGNRKIKLS